MKAFCKKAKERDEELKCLIRQHPTSLIQPEQRGALFRGGRSYKSQPRWMATNTEAIQEATLTQKLKTKKEPVHISGTDSYYVKKKKNPSQMIQTLTQMGITNMAQRVTKMYTLIAGRLHLFTPNWGNKLHTRLYNRLDETAYPTLFSKGADISTRGNK